jgi:hypothetical protein
MQFILKTILFIIEVTAALVLTLVAYIFCWLIALFVDKDGNLPTFLRWFQTPDATCYDDMWVAEHPTWSKYKIATTWIARNPAFGFRKFCSVGAKRCIVSKGNVNIADGEFGVAGWYFLVGDDSSWNLSFIINLGNGSCFRGSWGWYLLPLSKGYDSINTGMLEADLFRFYSFGVKGN